MPEKTEAQRQLELDAANWRRVTTLIGRGYHELRFDTGDEPSECSLTCYSVTVTGLGLTDLLAAMVRATAPRHEMDADGPGPHLKLAKSDAASPDL